MHRLTLAEQLQKTLRMPQQKGGLGSLLGKVLRTALSGVVVYAAVNVLAGKRGQRRLRQDFSTVAVRPISEHGNDTQVHYPLRVSERTFSNTSALKGATSE